VFYCVNQASAVKIKNERKKILAGLSSLFDLWMKSSSELRGCSYSFVVIFALQRNISCKMFKLEKLKTIIANDEYCQGFTSHS